MANQIAEYNVKRLQMSGDQDAPTGLHVNITYTNDNFIHKKTNTHYSNKYYYYYYIFY